LADAAPRPGLVLVFSGQSARYGVIALEDGQVEIGRETTLGGDIDDPLLSRRHAPGAFAAGRWGGTDLDSRDGTLVDGAPGRSSPAEGKELRVLRAGHNVFLLCRDIGEHRGRLTVDDAVVLGPAMQRLLRLVAKAATTGATLHIH